MEKGLEIAMLIGIGIVQGFIIAAWFMLGNVP